MFVWLDTSLQKPTRHLKLCSFFVNANGSLQTKTFRILNSVCYFVTGCIYRDLSLESTAVIIFNDNDHTDI